MAKSKLIKSAREEEIMNGAVDMNNRTVQAFMSDKFVQGSNQEASEIAIALRALISGQSDILSNQAKQSEEMARIRQRMAEMDEAAERWERDRQRFLEEVAEKARSIAGDPDKAIVRGSIEYTNALADARAKRVTDLLQWKQSLATMPKVTVVSPGEYVTVMNNGRPSMKVFAETVRIKDMVWTLQPGVPTEVPQVVAEVLRSRRRLEEENRARSDIMSKHMEQGVLENEWRKIDQKYNSPTARLGE